MRPVKTSAARQSVDLMMPFRLLALLDRLCVARQCCLSANPELYSCSAVSRVGLINKARNGLALFVGAHKKRDRCHDNRPGGRTTRRALNRVATTYNEDGEEVVDKCDG